MLIYSMSVSVDGFIADREGGFGWTAPNEEQFRLNPSECCRRGSASANHLSGGQRFRPACDSPMLQYEASRQRIGQDRCILAAVD